MLSDDLKLAVQQLKDQAAANKTSADAAVARIEATIAQLKGAQTGGSVDDATVTQAIADLGDALNEFKGVTAELDAEDPTPVPPASDAAKA